jgi:hypothetical protein
MQPRFKLKFVLNVDTKEISKVDMLWLIISDTMFTVFDGTVCSDIREFIAFVLCIIL